MFVLANIQKNIILTSFFEKKKITDLHLIESKVRLFYSISIDSFKVIAH